MTSRKEKLATIRRAQLSSQQSQDAYSRKTGYSARPKPSLPKMPWDDDNETDKATT